MSARYSISYAADEHYHSAALENGVQIVPKHTAVTAYANNIVTAAGHGLGLAAPCYYNHGGVFSGLLYAFPVNAGKVILYTTAEDATTDSGNNYAVIAYAGGDFVQAAAAPRNVLGLYITNSSANGIWVLLSDDAAGPHGIATNQGTVYPMAASPGDLAIGLHGGEEFQNGIYIGAYSTQALAIAGGAPDAGNILLIKADFTAAKYTPIT